MTDEGAEKIASAIRYLADSIHPGRGTAKDAQNGTVGSVTEAMMGQTSALTEIAQALNGVAEATTGGLIYGLKFGKEQGTSVAEAIENAGKAIEGAGSRIGGAVNELSSAIDNKP